MKPAAMQRQPTKWPKQLPELSAEQLRIRDAFMMLWHDELPQRYRLIERFNHGYPVRRRVKLPGKRRTLEIGAGLGTHLQFEDLDTQDYFALELRPEMAARLKERFPRCQTIVGDCQQSLPMPDAYFDRVLAIHVLEHLPNLPAALREIRRVLTPSGQFCVVIPCEGGFAYSLARRVSAQRIFEERFQQPYEWLIRSEHINEPDEILTELARLFEVRHRSFFPLMIPSVAVNLCIGLTLHPRRDSWRPTG
jgi:SAM-dependent methyltransferase